MVSHLYNRNIDIHHPASVSSKYYHMLPQYHGLYVTDDYFMAAVADKYTEAEFLILAIKAGADLVIFGRHPKMMKMLNKPIIPLVDFVNDLVKTHATFP